VTGCKSAADQQGPFTEDSFEGLITTSTSDVVTTSGGLLNYLAGAGNFEHLLTNSYQYYIHASN
jgi:hypothetical protein